jgi:hypothetical protein
MVEYGGVVAALTVLTAALAALAANLQALPLRDAKALPLVAKVADEKGLPRAQLKNVYRKAPYRKPFLRYLYTLGYAAGDPQQCALERVFGPTPVGDVVAELKKNASVLARLKRGKVTVLTAARAFQRGFTARCG